MDEKVRYTRYNYKKTKKNSGLAKTILSFLAMSVFVVIVGIMLANIIIHFLPLNDASETQANSEAVNQSENIDNSEAENAAARKRGDAFRPRALHRPGGNGVFAHTAYDGYRDGEPHGRLRIDALRNSLYRPRQDDAR